MNLPVKVCVSVKEEASIKSPEKRAREWCGSVVGAMVWLSSILPDASYVFRGQANSNWPLESSLFRAVRPTDLKRLLLEENRLLRRISDDAWFRQEFGTPAARDRSNTNYDRTVAILQHQGIPTRLLDATADPLVGLYFAVVGKYSASDMDNVDASVLLFRNVAPSDQLPIRIVRAPQVSPRVTAQRAHFIAPARKAKPGVASADTVAIDFFNISATNGSLTNFDNLISNYLKGKFPGRPPTKAPNILAFHIPRALKPACREVLKSMGVSASNLFPGSEGVRREFSGL